MSILLLFAVRNCSIVGLGVGRIPVVGVGLADVLERVAVLSPTGGRPASTMPARRKSALASALLPLMTTKLPGVLDLQERLGLHLADELVVEGDVEGLRILDQAVIGDDRDAVGDRRGDGRLDGRAVLGEDDDDLGALRDQVLDVRRLRLGRRLRVVRDVRAAAGLDRRLEGRLVPLRPALFLVVVPGDADDAVGGRRRPLGAGAAVAGAAVAGPRSRAAAGGDDDRDRRRERRIFD